MSAVSPKRRSRSDASSPIRSGGRSRQKCLATTRRVRGERRSRRPEPAGEDGGEQLRLGVWRVDDDDVEAVRRRSRAAQPGERTRHRTTVAAGPASPVARRLSAIVLDAPSIALHERGRPPHPARAPRSRPRRCRRTGPGRVAPSRSGSRIANSVCFTRSASGRVPSPGGAASRRPAARPAMTRPASAIGPCGGPGVGRFEDVEQAGDGVHDAARRDRAPRSPSRSSPTVPGGAGCRASRPPAPARRRCRAGRRRTRCSAGASPVAATSRSKNSGSGFVAPNVCELATRSNGTPSAASACFARRRLVAGDPDQEARVRIAARPSPDVRIEVLRLDPRRRRDGRARGGAARQSTPGATTSKTRR